MVGLLVIIVAEVFNVQIYENFSIAQKSLFYQSFCGLRFLVIYLNDNALSRLQ